MQVLRNLFHGETHFRRSQRGFSLAALRVGILVLLYPFSYSHPKETKLYYLNSRYYDPEMGRFINADMQFDDAAGFIGYNLFSYCANNPIIFKDDNGSSIIVCIIIGAIVGFGIGGLYGAYQASESGYSASDWEYWKTVASYGAVGAFGGGLCGWGFGTIATSAAAVTIGSSGSGGIIIYESWQAAEQALRESIGSVTEYGQRIFQTPFGNRVVDAFNRAEGLIAEAKYGYQSLSSFIRLEIQRDAWLLENHYVESVEWHFFYSASSNSAGVSAQLFQALSEAGITVIYHF